ncbi:S-adenosylmethionine:tRNA ribosyltransferase-isomerase, partial [Staphylococcus epidermidis]|uniref:S-adenosylmethionine:tRNA ribosyltransferase-isomerase n=1 Tax=Staphylococcus epidermidis TaxID=1282 RepID=UPI0037D9D62C
MLLLTKDTPDLTHLHFTHLIHYFHPPHTFLLNHTPLIPPTLFPLKQQTPAKLQILILTQIQPNHSQLLLKPPNTVKKPHPLN